MAKVALTSTRTKNSSNEEINEAVERAFELLGFHFNDKIMNVVIKPNLCYYWDYSTGETTDPIVVSAAIDFIRDQTRKDVNILVAEADASAMKTKYAFKVLGYERLSQEKNVKLVNLSEGDIIERKVKVENRELRLPINKILLEADVVISVPKFKTHKITGVTCALKNMFGSIAKPRKYVYHKILSHAIVGVNKIVRSDIVLVDGIIVCGTHPRKMGILLIGDNPLATDFVAAEIMGFNPKKIPYLNLAKKEKIGNVDQINIVEDCVRLEEVKKNFPGSNYLLHKVSWKLQLKMLRTYATIVGDVIPPVLEL